MLNRPMQLNRITEGAEPQPLGDFAAKVAILTPFQTHFSRF